MEHKSSHLCWEKIDLYYKEWVKKILFVTTIQSTTTITAGLVCPKWWQERRTKGRTGTKKESTPTTGFLKKSSSFGHTRRKRTNSSSYHHPPSLHHPLPLVQTLHPSKIIFFFPYPQEGQFYWDRHPPSMHDPLDSGSKEHERTFIN